MSINLVAICDNDKVAKELEQTCEKLGYTINCEIQGAGGIVDKLTDEQLDKAIAILIVTQKEFEQIEDKERFKNRNYYQVVPLFVMQNAKDIIEEILYDSK